MPAADGKMLTFIGCVLIDFPLKNSKKTYETSPKPQNFPACGGLIQNNDKRLSIRFIKFDFGRQRRPIFFGVDLLKGKFGLNPPPLLGADFEQGGV